MDSIVKTLTFISVLVSQLFYLIPQHILPHTDSRSMSKNLKVWNSST
jgi:hypothetical protein